MSEWTQFDLKTWLAEPDAWLVQYSDYGAADWRGALELPAMRLDGTPKHPSCWRMRRKPQPVVRYICVRTEDGGESCVTSVHQYLSNEAKKRWSQFRVTFGERDEDCSCVRVK